VKARFGILILVVLVLLNILAGYVVGRWDMTDDKRYTLSDSSKQILEQLDSTLVVTILLDGELNSGFTRLKKATEELVEEFSIYAAHGIRVDTASAELLEFFPPTVIQERTNKGKMAQTTVYPFAVVEYKGKKTPVSLLYNQPGLDGEDNLNRSIELLEFNFINAIRLLTKEEVKKVAFLEGHGELEEQYVNDFTRQLEQYYQVYRGQIGDSVGILDDFAAVIIADPQMAFSDQHKFIIDQYIMQGGRVLWLLDGVFYSYEWLSEEGSTPILALDLNLNDLLFRYGVRVTHGLVQDLQCRLFPVDMSSDPEQPNWQPMQWTYAPLLLPTSGSPITENLSEPLMSDMISAVELVGSGSDIQKNVLLTTSSKSKITPVPAEVNLGLEVGDESTYQRANIPVAVSLDGEFTSLYAYLDAPDSVKTIGPVLKKSSRTRQVVVADGSIIRNEWQGDQSLPLGLDRYTQTLYGNAEFLINTVLYLTGDEDDIALRQLKQRVVTLRLIDDVRAAKFRIPAQVVSIIIPLLVLALIGGVVFVIRHRKYVKKS
jgi:gliding-associated putative ABC transporter substrate-binding component GldG